MLYEIIKWLINKFYKNNNVSHLVVIIYRIWIKKHKELPTKESVISFIEMVLHVMSHIDSSYSKTYSEILKESKNLINNNGAAEPKMQCPKCKRLNIIPKMKGKCTAYWIKKNETLKELNFDCYNCGYKKLLNITAPLDGWYKRI